MQNREYWEERINNALSLTEKQVTTRMKKLYKQAYKNIQHELLIIWNDMLASGEVSNTALMTHERYKTLQELIQRELHFLGEKQIEFMQMSLIEVFFRGQIALEESLNIPPTTLNEKVAEEIVRQAYKGATFSERIWADMSLLKEQIEKKIIETAIQGKDVRKVSKELQERLNVGLSDAKRIVITETSNVFNEACRNRAIENGYTSYTVLTERGACEKCTPLKGKHFSLYEKVLPKHPYCKCTMLIDVE